MIYIFSAIMGCIIGFSFSKSHEEEIQKEKELEKIAKDQNINLDGLHKLLFGNKNNE